jgi:hypothetical protein
MARGSEFIDAGPCSEYRQMMHPAIAAMHAGCAWPILSYRERCPAPGCMRCAAAIRWRSRTWLSRSIIVCWGCTN